MGQRREHQRRANGTATQRARLNRPEQMSPKVGSGRPPLQLRAGVIGQTAGIRASPSADARAVIAGAQEDAGAEHDLIANSVRRTRHVPANARGHVA